GCGLVKVFKNPQFLLSGARSWLSIPEFDGTPSECREFLVHVDIHFKLNPQMFITDIAKVGFIINHLSGRALTWANPLWEAEKPIIQNY
uniref:DUF4939 domain-containing protein n=1 Tax=Leptobrachium leishanense TaxID=445787 RepID=A0A8C5PUR0_9ANUR